MNCVGSVYSNQMSVGSVMIGFCAWTVADHRNNERNAVMTAYLLALLTEGGCNFFFRECSVF